MKKPAPVVFLLDVDNTLLDSDRLITHLRAHLKKTFGQRRQKLYWNIFEELREKVGYADYLGALQRYRIDNPLDWHFLKISSYLLDYPFKDLLYPGALKLIKRFRKWGPTVILSDGDVVFQPHKIERSGLYDAVKGRVLIYIHKDKELDDVKKHFPARHYVLVDDKLRILTAVKKEWGTHVTTVCPRQGHYAKDPEEWAKYDAPDISIKSIGDLLRYDLPTLIDAGKEKAK